MCRWLGVYALSKASDWKSHLSSLKEQR